ncbi:MAG: hypothetical protein HQL90_15255 [Magnetococcales bacterium]|nr:hypothetical protein [Magnetococcales bacterium]
MGIAVAAHRVTPSRSQPIPPPMGQGEHSSARKCHYLTTHCRACGRLLSISYPLAVTFWKFNCTGCNKPYSIEIVGQRKCLVYEQLGRKNVERIGLTQERSVYYRAKCYGCNAVIIVPKSEQGKVQSCHQCRLDFTVSESQNEIFYETVIQYQGHPVTFRDKVQQLEGYILNRGNMFFLDEDMGNRGQQSLLESLSQLENELTALRSQGGSQQNLAMRFQAEKNSLLQKLKQQMEQSTLLAERLRTLEAQTQVWETEKQQYVSRLSQYDEVIRHLDQKTELGARLEGKLEGLNRAIRELTSEKEALQGKLAGQSELLKRLEQEKAQNAEWLSRHRVSYAEYQRLLRENNVLEEKIVGYNELLRDLDRQTERAAKFETMYLEASFTVKKLTGENHQLANRLTGQAELVRDLERQSARVVQLEGLNRALEQQVGKLQGDVQRYSGQIYNDKSLQQQWEQEKKRVMELELFHRDALRQLEQSVLENRALSSRLSEREARVVVLEKQLKQAGRGGMEGSELELRLRTLQQENKRLEAKSLEQARLEARLIELETEVNVLRRRGQDRPEPPEEWYCEEGEEASISAQEKNFQERRILGLKGEPTPERVKAALRRRIRKYHPDMVASMGLELRELAHRKTQEITRAYSTLMRGCGKG